MKFQIKKNITDILFVILIIGILLLPMFFLNKNEISKFENRQLATLPAIKTKDNKINFNFGKDFEEYFKDRFFLRNQFIQFYCNVKYYLSITIYQYENKFYNKKTNLMIGKIYNWIPSLNDKEKEATIANLSKLKTFCNNNNIKLYILIPPGRILANKSDYYPTLINDKSYIGITNIANWIEETLDIKVIYPYKQLADGVKYGDEPLFFKTDTHWTDTGAYIAYLALMKEIKRNFPNVKITNLKDFRTIKLNLVRVCPVYGFFEGNYYKAMHINDKKILDTEYTYFRPAGKVIEEHKTYSGKSYIKNFYINEDNKSAPNIFLYGDSTSLNLLPSFASSFYKTNSIFIWVNEDKELEENINIKQFEDDIIKSGADILVICFLNTTRLRYLYKD